MSRLAKSSSRRNQSLLTLKTLPCVSKAWTSDCWRNGPLRRDPPPAAPALALALLLGGMLLLLKKIYHAQKALIKEHSRLRGPACRHAAAADALPPMLSFSNLIISDSSYLPASSTHPKLASFANCLACHLPRTALLAAHCQTDSSSGFEILATDQLLILFHCLLKTYL